VRRAQYRLVQRLARPPRYAQVGELHSRLLGAEADAAEVNEQEALFGWAATRYAALPRLLAAVQPYLQLWTTVSRLYQSSSAWMNGPLARLVPEELSEQVERASAALERLAAEFAAGGGGGGARDAPAAVVREAQAKAAKLWQYLPLVAAVCNPGLQERHLAAMSEVAGLEIRRDEVGGAHARSHPPTPPCLHCRHCLPPATALPPLVAVSYCCLLGGSPLQLHQLGHLA
jgi:dynein heavy chain